ncbi:MAG: Fe-S cluster assembly ATPase SufC [Candidatus Coatesbacteria bacterium]
MSSSLEIRNLRVAVAGKEIVQGITLTIRAGEKHALMGPNGSGKSTLSNALMGHPAYTILSGEILLNGEDIAKMPADERSRKGLFLAFQYPVAIPGVSVANFLRSAVKARVPKNVKDGDSEAMRGFRKTLKAAMDELSIDPAFATRYLNDGFSGGEKKRIEILQMAILKPSIAILDETDSGLDIDALRVVSDGINRVCGPETGVLLITHYQRLLNYVKPDFVHVLIHGRIVRSGGPELALELEAGGYESFGLAPDRAAGG